MMRRPLKFALLFLLLLGCTSQQERSEQLLQAAKTALRQGEFRKAEDLANRGLKSAISVKDRLLEWRFRLLLCEASLPNHPAPEILAEVLKPFPSTLEFASLAGRRKMLEGAALFALGRAVESGEAYSLAHDLAAAAHDQEALCDIEIRQGSRLLQQSKWEEAEQTLTSALHRAQAAGLRYESAGALVNLGMSRVDRHRYDEAINYFQRAAQTSSSESLILYSVAQSNLATCYYSLGDFDRAIQIDTQSIEQQKRSGAKLYLERALGEAGHAYLRKGDQKQAADHLTLALKIAKEIGRDRDAALWAGNLAGLYSEAGDWNQAELFNQEAIQLKTKAHVRTEVYNRLIAAEIAIGRRQFALGDGQYQQIISEHQDDPALLWDAYRDFGQSLLIQGKPKQATRYFELAVELVEKTRADLLKTEYKLPFLTRLIRLYQLYVDALISQGDFDRALAVSDSSRAQTLSDRPGSASIRHRSIESFQKIARDRAVTVVAYWLGPQQSQAWIITSQKVKRVPLTAEQTLTELVTKYNEAIQNRLVDPRHTHIPEGEELFRQLVAPLSRFIPPASPIIIVPDGALSSLNFETLPVPESNPPRFWVQDVTVAVAPSINVLDGIMRNSSPGNTLLLIGDPEATDRTLPPLNSASEEITNVTRYYHPGSCRILQRASAVPHAYRRANPERFDAIHFTAHATASRDSPMDSAIHLTGGELYARDVLDVPLRATLVTISGCRGIGSRNYSGEGLVGFAWAFLRSGARNVLAGLWDVNDRSTAELMNIFYREFSGGRPPIEALRTAKIALITSGTNFQKPYYWGAFQLYTVWPAGR